MNKERVKGIVMGFILCAVLSTSVMAVAATRTETRQITFGVRVNLNGQLMQFPADSQPFVMDGRTFLPVRAMADALGLPVDFNAATNTAYLGNRHAGARTPLNTAAPFFDSGGPWGTSVERLDSVSMGGVTYQNALRFRNTSLDGGTRFSLHNLNGQFRMLTGYIGRVDGSAMQDVTINFIGDGQLLHSYELRATDMPTSVSVFVESVTQLRIEVTYPRRRTSTAAVDYAVVAFLE